MMADYIKREDAIKQIENAQIISDGENCGYCCDDISISSIPAADVHENIYGEWKDIGNLNNAVCSVCGAFYDVLQKTGEMNFCPNCGADMIGFYDDAAV